MRLYVLPTAALNNSCCIWLALKLLTLLSFSPSMLEKNRWWRKTNAESLRRKHIPLVSLFEPKWQKGTSSSSRVLSTRLHFSFARFYYETEIPADIGVAS